MRIGNRLFPYPLLNHEKLYSQYKDGYFNLIFKDCIITDDKNYIIEGLKFETNSSFLKELINNEQVKVYCNIECAQTMYRKTFEITENPIDLIIPLYDLSGKIAIKAFAIALDDIKSFKSDEFDNDYEDYSFDIEKNDILAVDDGYNTRIDFDSDDDTKKSSIFLIIKDKKIKDEIMQTEFDSNRITIKLPETEWDMYDKTKKQNKFENFYFSIIAIPALTYALASLQKNSDDVDQLCIDYKWFNSFKKKYEEVTKEVLDNDAFSKINPSVEAQRLLNAPSTKSISEIFDMLVMPNVGGTDND